MVKKIILPILFLFSFSLFSQVGIGTNSPDASSVLDIRSASNDKGILIPRMTQAQRNAISSPAIGLMIFQTDGNIGFYFYNGSSWEGFGEVKTVNGNSPAPNGNVTLTFLATQTGTQAFRAATASPSDGLVHIVTGDLPAENNKVYIYSSGLATWTLSTSFTDTDEQDISGSSFNNTTNALLIDIEDGSGQTLDLSALDELTVDADPASNLGGASEGDLAYDTTDNQLQAFDGTNWLAVYSGSVTPSLDQVTDVGSSTTNGIDVGSLTVNSAFILPTTTGLPGQVLTVSTTTSELVFKNSGLPTGTANGDIIHYNGTGEWERTDELVVPFGGTGPILANRSIDPRTNDIHDIGDAAAIFSKGYFKEINSGSGSVSLTFNSTATGTPTISFQQGGTEIAGIGSSTFFVGDSSLGNHYFFPSATETSTFSQVLTYNSSINSNTLFWHDFVLVSPALNDGAVLRWNNTTKRWIENTDLKLDDSAYTDNITLGASIIPRASNLDLGRPSDRFEAVYTNSIDSNTSSLTISSSATGTPTISFQQGGTEIAGIGSSTFFIGDSSLGNHYFFPQTGGGLGDVLAFTNTNTLEIFSISNLEQDDLDDVLRRDPTSNRDANIRSLTASNTIQSEGSAIFANATSNDDIILGSDNSDDLIINADLESNLDFDADNTYQIGSQTKNANLVNTRVIRSNNNLTITSSSTISNNNILFDIDGNIKSGINSNTFYVGNSGSRYEFPIERPATINNQVLAYTATNSLTFMTIATLPSGTSTGTTLRYNPSSSSWEETELLKIDPGGTFANNITVSNTLVPFTDNIIDLGKTSYEYRNIFSQKIETGQADLEIETNGNTAYLKIGDSTYGALYLNDIQNAQGLTGNTVFGLRSFRTLLGAAEYNIVLGPDNLTDTNLTGNFNIALGSLNQEKNVSGNNNISIGRNTLTENVTQSNLIAIGNEALRNTTALGNIGIGEQVLKTNDSGENNIGVGNNSLYQGSNFNSNVAIGNGALQNNNSNNNTALGHKALDFNTNTGGSNTAIGFGADLGSSGIANSTVIGANATVTTSNTIQLGDTGISNVNTSGVVSATGYKTSGTATITTLTVGDSSKYTLPLTRGTVGQVLTVSSTTSQLVFSDPSSTYSPTYLLVNAGGSQTLSSAGQDFTFDAPVSANGISISSNTTFNLPSGKIYKLVAYIDGKGLSGASNISFQFVDNGTNVGVVGIYNTPDGSQDKSNSVPATAIVNCISSNTTVVLDLKSISANMGITNRTYVLIEEL